MHKFKKFTILVVDDDAELRELISMIFEDEGFTVLTADSGNSAFELVLTCQIDLVISDMRMPDGDGMSLLAKIRDYNPEIPIVIFVTGFSDVSVNDCIKKGAKTVIKKPFNQKELIGSVIAALGQQ